MFFLTARPRSRIQTPEGLARLKAEAAGRRAAKNEEGPGWRTERSPGYTSRLAPWQADGPRDRDFVSGLRFNPSKVILVRFLKTRKLGLSERFSVACGSEHTTFAARPAASYKHVGQPTVSTRGGLAGFFTASCELNGHRFSRISRHVTGSGTRECV